MPTLTKTNASTHLDIPGYVDTFERDVDGWTVTMEKTLTDLDLAPFYRGCTDDRCQAHHVGYVVKGRFGVRYADGTEEQFSAGDAFVIAPGHTPVQYADSEYVAFTPTPEATAQTPVIMANMVTYAREHGIPIPEQLLSQ
jgi:hypothetical protein